MKEEAKELSDACKKRLTVVTDSLGNLDESLVELLQSSYELKTTSDYQLALNASQADGESQWLLVDALTVLGRDSDSAERQTIDILNHIAEGVCIVNCDGLILWANHKMEQFGLAVREGVSIKSRDAFNYFIKCDLSKMGLEDPKRSRKYSFTEESSDRYFEMSVSPILDGQGNILRVATIVWEATASRRLQKRINAIDKAGSELVRIEAETLSGLNVEQRISLLQDKIVRYARDMLSFDGFSIRLLNKSNNQLERLFGIGCVGEDQEIFANVENNGITGYVAASGRSYICNNPGSDSHYLAGLDNGCRVLAVPLRLHDHVIGVMNIQRETGYAFSEEDRQVAEIFGRYIAIAMNILNLMVVERHQTTGQAIEELSQAVAEPLAAILTSIGQLQEEYIGHDDLRRRLGQVIDRASEIKSAIKDMKNGPRGIVGLRSGNEDSAAADQRFAGKRILVVDDEEFIRQTIVDVVTEKGCNANCAADGRQAIELLEQQRYDLVISDIKMPHATGYEVFAAARQIDPDIRVILMTGFGYDPNHSIVRANREGLNAVLYKPFKVEQLLNDVAEALGVG